MMTMTMTMAMPMRTTDDDDNDVDDDDDDDDDGFAMMTTMMALRSTGRHGAQHWCGRGDCEGEERMIARRQLNCAVL